MTAALSQVHAEARPSVTDAEAMVLRASDPLSRDAFRSVRRQMTLAYCKWDPQVQDVCTLAPFALRMRSATWDDLRRRAERLAAETIAIEQALLRRPDLFRRLGLPRRLATLLRSAAAPTPAAVRSMRFDFHPTPDGWRISEVNSDVPGGFSEASSLSRLVAEHVPRAAPAGDPAGVWAAAMARHGGSIALLSAAGYMEDQQVVSYLARRLREVGVEAHLAQPAHLRWRDGRASLQTAWSTATLSAVVRFYQGEWLARLGRRADWRPLFVGGRTPVANPGFAVLSESKRLPLVWDALGLPLPAWRAHLPDTRELRDAPWRTDDRWLIKTAYCNTGDAVAYAGLLPPDKWRRARFDAWLRPNDWIAQRRFQTLPVQTPSGLMYPCIGVHTVDGVACGIYGRLSPTPVINYAAVDVAVLVDERGSSAERPHRPPPALRAVEVP